MKIKKFMLGMSVMSCLALGCTGCGINLLSEDHLSSTAEISTLPPETMETQIESENGLENETQNETQNESDALAAETNAEIDLSGEDSSMEQVVANSIFEKRSGQFTGEECQAEGHIILGEEIDEGVLKVYALTMYGEYAFHNVDYFVKEAGTGVIPAVMTYDLLLSTVQTTSDVEWPEDGSGYEESVKQMFPEKYWDRVLTIQDEDLAVLTEMEQGYAKAYLEELGRDAIIGEYADVPHTLLTDYGISVDVSNKMLEYEKLMGPNPNWVGSTEKIEDGVRYMYLVFYEEETNEIIYEKRVFDTNESVEKFVYDAETGEEITK